MEVVDSSVSVMDDVAVIMGSVARRANAARNDDTSNNSLHCVENTNGIKPAKDEDVRDNVESADTVGAEDSRSIETNNISMDQSAKGDGNDSESDGDSTSEGTCLEAMTRDGQDYYLRLGDTPRRRSALRLSRIIARKQLLRRLAQGRTREGYGKVIMCPSV